MDPYILTALLLIIPGSLILLVALFGKKFHEKKEWQEWPMEAGIVGIFASLADDRFGRKGVQILIVGLSIMVIALGLWILSLR